MIRRADDGDVIVIGGGPAGLTAAFTLIGYGIKPTVLEKSTLVGGIARTEQYKGFHFDMGGHRFFTKSPEVQRLWQDVLGEDFLQRPRLSRIYYNNKFFHYPLRPINALAGLGLRESILIVGSYLRWQVWPYPQEESFEQWVTNRFGRRLFRTFFKTYTEKVWGISCTELKAEWAAQRIKDLSLRKAMFNSINKSRNAPTTLIESFHYPRQGPGMLWNRVRACIEAGGGTVQLETEVREILRDGLKINGVVVSQHGCTQRLDAAQVISSMPVSEFIRRLTPPAPPKVLEAAQSLKYRDFLTVCLIINREDLFPDNWIYIHEPQVRVGRIQNFKNWSPEMVPDLSKTSLGLEYFCNEGDALWRMTDDELIELAKRELAQIGLASVQDVEDGCVFRVPKAYPVYDADYAGHLHVVQAFVESLQNGCTIGRNGLHRYNNQDHSMLTAMYAVRNLVLGEQNDLWSVNADQEYHEEIQNNRTNGQAQRNEKSFRPSDARHASWWPRQVSTPELEKEEPL